MLVLLVRHGHAGAKRHWRGDDSLRPLDELGLAQSEALTRVLAPFPPKRILTSPFLRCYQSVSPLADALGIPIEHSPSLVPDAGVDAKSLALEISTDGSGAVVLCTHGEVIREMQADLGPDGPPSFSTHSLREKGSVWVL